MAGPYANSYCVIHGYSRPCITLLNIYSFGACCVIVILLNIGGGTKSEMVTFCIIYGRMGWLKQQVCQKYSQGLLGGKCEERVSALNKEKQQRMRRKGEKTLTQVVPSMFVVKYFSNQKIKLWYYTNNRHQDSSVMVSGPTNFFSPVEWSLFSVTALAPSTRNFLILVANLYEDKIVLYNVS